ncbi:MAG: hypothetical protein LKJ03_11155 [Enterococcaceae bacterium]|jgi:hypothetical protein|nr:hypothetical protein [Enterococcaceae bacterium]
MDYHAFLKDLEKWMDANNEMVRQMSITSDDYWNWVVGSSCYLSEKHGNHPLVMMIINAIWKYQEENYKKFVEGE